MSLDSLGREDDLKFNFDSVLERFVITLKKENDKMFEELQIVKKKLFEVESQIEIPSNFVGIHGHLVTEFCEFEMINYNHDHKNFTDIFAQKLAQLGVHFTLIGYNEKEKIGGKFFTKIIVHLKQNYNMGPILKKLENMMDKTTVERIHYYPCDGLVHFLQYEYNVAEKQKQIMGSEETKMWINSENGFLSKFIELKIPDSYLFHHQ